MENQPTGLRERKYIETQSRLEDAALTLVEAHGLEKTTVDAISEMANVSPRTFFNYFDSKEDAVLGFYRTSLQDKASPPLVYDSNKDIVENAVTLMIDLFGPALGNPSYRKKRKLLIRRHSQLLEKQFARIATITEQVTKMVNEIISQTQPKNNDVHAEVIVMACLGGVKVAVKEWLTTNTELSSTNNLKQRSTEIVREAIRIL